MGKGRNQIIGVALAGGIVALFASGLGRESVRRDVGPEVDKVAADPRDKCRWPGGSIHNFAGQVQRMLRNPPSFEHVGVLAPFLQKVTLSKSLKLRIDLRVLGASH